MSTAEKPREVDSTSTPCGDSPTRNKSPKSLFHNLRTSCTRIGEELSHDGDRRELNHEKERTSQKAQERSQHRLPAAESTKQLRPPERACRALPSSHSKNEEQPTEAPARQT